MSRSNPSTQTHNPAKTWFEVNGETGTIFHYDRELKKKINHDLPFVFILLEEKMSVIKGWHEASEDGIISNEVRDTRQEVFVVRTYKGIPIASGHYNFIKDKVAAAGGGYNKNLYIAFKDTNSSLAIGSLMLKGAALSAWFDFYKKTSNLPATSGGKKCHITNVKAVVIKSFSEGKKGSIKFKYPDFSLSEIKPETNEAAIALDRELQEFLTAYLQRSKAEAAAQPTHEGVQEDVPVGNQEAPEPEPPSEPEPNPEPENDDVPF
jgi:hypothetical protein